MTAPGRSGSKPSVADMQDRDRQRWREAAARHRLQVLDEAAATAPIRAMRRQAALAYDGPSMVAGRGDRREDCARYDACLDRWVLLTGGDRAHCPDGCSGYAPRPRDEVARSSNFGIEHVEAR